MINHGAQVKSVYEKTLLFFFTFQLFFKNKFIFFLLLLLSVKITEFKHYSFFEVFRKN